MDDTGAPVYFLFCVVTPTFVCRIFFNTGAGKRIECLGADVGP